LDSVATNWENEAKREDARAEQESVQ
jgi:hypothetical protein